MSFKLISSFPLEFLQHVAETTLNKLHTDSSIVKGAKQLVDLGIKLQGFHFGKHHDAEHKDTTKTSSKTVKYEKKVTTTQNIDLGKMSDQDSDNLVKKFQTFESNQQLFGSNEKLMREFFGEKDAAEFINMLHTLNDNNMLVAGDSALLTSHH